MRYKIANKNSLENKYIMETDDKIEAINKLIELDSNQSSKKYSYYIVDSKSKPIPFNTYDITDYEILERKVD